MSIDQQILAALQRIEAQLGTLIAALADEDDEPVQHTLDGQLMPAERDQSRSLG